MSVRQAVDWICPPFLLGFKRRVEASSFATRLIRGTFWSLVATVFSRMLGLAASMLVARMLGKIGLGELGIVQSTVGMFSSLAGLGLGLAATKHIAEQRIHDPAAAGETIGFLSLISWTSGGFMTLLVLLLAPWLAAHSLAAPKLAPMLQEGSLLLLFGVINGVQTGVLSGFEAFKTIARVNLISGLANFPILVGGAYFGGLAGVVCGMVAVLALNCYLNFRAVRSEAAASGIVICYRDVNKHFNLIWSFGLPGMLCGLISGPANWVANTMLVNQHGGYGEMGLLNASNTWFQAMSFFPNLLGQVLLPILATYIAAKDNRGTVRALTITTSLNFLIVLPLAMAGCLFSRQIMELYGPGFVEGGPVLIITLICGGIMIIQAPITNQLVAAGKMWSYLATNIAWGFVFVIGSYLFVSHGAVGNASSRLVAYVVSGIGVLLALRFGSDRA